MRAALHLIDSDLHDAVQGSGSVYFGWDEPASPTGITAIADVLFSGLAEGRTTGFVYDEMGESVVEPYEDARMIRVAPPGGGDKRIREIVTLIDPSTGKEIKDSTVLAIDGGSDGLDLARSCLEVIGAHLAPGGAAVLQLGYAEQVSALASAIASNGLEVVAQRSEERGVLVRLARASLVG